MKRVVITAGPVYGRLDANKIVSNRIRGLWALAFAGYLSARGHQVTLVLPDTMPKDNDLDLGTYPSGVPVKVRRHTGFNSYQAICTELAVEADSMVLAAAVVNWIPAEPSEGKMPTKGFKEGDIINVPFKLAPYVINRMRTDNPKLTLIGCKMLVNASEDELLDAAYGVLLKAHCNAVIANDMGKGLKRKLIVNKDRSVQEFNDDFEGFYDALTKLVEDEHFSTRFAHISVEEDDPGDLCVDARLDFDRIVDRYRDKFIPVEGGRVFGSVAINTHGAGWLVSPREKGGMFTSADATLVTKIDWDQHVVTVPTCWNKPTLNAPLLIRFLHHFNYLAAVHFHKQVEGLPTLPYAQPGTVRDNCRGITEEMWNGFNIEGHGCVVPVCLDTLECTCSYDESEEMTRHAPLCDVTKAGKNW